MECKTISFQCHQDISLSFGVGSNFMVEVNQLRYKRSDLDSPLFLLPFCPVEY